MQNLFIRRFKKLFVDGYDNGTLIFPLAGAQYGLTVLHSCRNVELLGLCRHGVIGPSSFCHIKHPRLECRCELRCIFARRQQTRRHNILRQDIVHVPFIKICH